MHQRTWYLDTVRKTYKGSKFFCRGSKIISSTKIHVHFGDVLRVMMVILGSVQFVCPPLISYCSQENFLFAAYICLTMVTTPKTIQISFEAQ